MKDSFDIRRWIENPEELLLIAGPCSVESREQFFKTSLKLSELHQINILRGGIWKPRTRPNGFEGIGEEGLKWMKEISNDTGLPVMTEVATPQHVELALKYNVDALWIGARTTANPFSMQQLADAENLMFYGHAAPYAEETAQARETFRGLYRGLSLWQKAIFQLRRICLPAVLRGEIAK